MGGDRGVGTLHASCDYQADGMHPTGMLSRYYLFLLITMRPLAQDKFPKLVFPCIIT